MIHDADRGYRSECGDPAEHRNKFQYSSQCSQCECVGEPQQQQSSGIEHERKAAKKELRSYISGKHPVQLTRQGSNPRTPISGKKQTNQEVDDVVPVAQEEDCQYGNKESPAKNLRSIRKEMIHTLNESLHIVFVSSKEN